MTENTVRINPAELRSWLDAHGLTYKEVSYKLAKQNKLAKDKED